MSGLPERIERLLPGRCSTGGDCLCGTCQDAIQVRREIAAALEERFVAGIAEGLKGTKPLEAIRRGEDA